jgi:hypothetical protein
MYKLPHSIILASLPLLLTGCDNPFQRATKTSDNACWTEKSGDFNVAGNVLMSIRESGHVRIYNKDCGGTSVGLIIDSRDKIKIDQVFEKNRRERLFDIVIPAYIEGRKIGDRGKRNLIVKIHYLKIEEDVKPTFSRNY